MKADAAWQIEEARIVAPFTDVNDLALRQRPETAKGTVFITLEDETGNVNVIVWPGLLEEQRREVMGATLLAVYGQWQTANNVRHLVLVDLSHLLGEPDTRSRNFH